MHNAATCPTCQTHALTRNHYFTGKLMVERDFTDEQHYFRERLRLHNQRLHGSGVACGLAVKQHPNPACQSRYVLLEPGSAIDCCGNDILVTAEDTVDITSFPAVQAITDTNAHVLQLVICYRECPTEDIPVLYDDCACDDSQCAPNRILESYRLDVIVDPTPAPAVQADQPTLERTGTLPFVAPVAVALDATGGKLYVLTATTLYQLDSATQAMITSLPLGRTATAMAITPDGTRLYLAIAPQTGSTTVDGQVWMIDATTLSASTAESFTATGTGTSVPLFAMTSQAQLVAAYPNGSVYAWLPADHADAPSGTASLPNNITGLAVSSDGKTAWIVRGGSALEVLDLTKPTATPPFNPQTNTVTNASMSVLATLPRNPDKLAAADATTGSLYLVDPTQTSAAPLATMTLAAAASSLASSPDGNWIYAADANGAIEVVDAGRLIANLTVTPPAPFAVGTGTEGIVVTPSGLTLYVPYTGAKADGSQGGVAIISIADVDCGAVLREVRACPSCGSGDCLVLATFDGYQPGFAMLDPADPAPTAQADAGNDISRIDDVTDRKFLASTETLQQVVECLLANGCGCAGAASAAHQGVPNTNGFVPLGTSGSNNAFVPFENANNNAEVPYENVSNGNFVPVGMSAANGTFVPVGVSAANGTFLPFGVNAASASAQTAVARITQLSWAHDTASQLATVNNIAAGATGVYPPATTMQGFIVGFSASVQVVGGVASTQVVSNGSSVFQVEMSPTPGANVANLTNASAFTCMCRLGGYVVYVTNIQTDKKTGVIVSADYSATPAAGIAYVVAPAIAKSLSGYVSIKVLGDFIVDTKNGNAVAAQFIRGSLPTGDLRTLPLPTGAPTALASPALPGGQFLSWFTL